LNTPKNISTTNDNGDLDPVFDTGFDFGSVTIQDGLINTKLLRPHKGFTA
jgi:hypothetical protein